MEDQNNIFNYATLLKQVKARVVLAQKKAIYAANEEMLSMYWISGSFCMKARNKSDGAITRSNNYSGI